jgi:hypothetical protein
MHLADGDAKRVQTIQSNIQSEWKKPVGARRHRREDNIKTDLS